MSPCPSPLMIITKIVNFRVVLTEYLPQVLCKDRVFTPHRLLEEVRLRLTFPVDINVLKYFWKFSGKETG